VALATRRIPLGLAIALLVVAVTAAAAKALADYRKLAG